MSVRLLPWTLILTIVVQSISARAQNVKLTDYDVPVSRAQRLDFFGSMRITGDNNRTSSRYEFSGDWESFYNSLPYAWWINLSSDCRVDKYYGSQTRYQESAVIDGDIRKYFKREGLFFGGAKVRSSWEDSYKHVKVWVGWSLGLGRFVDATALAKALRIEEFLIKEKIITVHLPQQTMLQLASIIDREREYKTRYGETYWVRWHEDMEQTILSGGQVTGGGIGPVGHLRIREVIEREPIRPRAHGWKVEAGEGLYISQARISGKAMSWQYLAGTFSLPLGRRGQLTASGRVDSPEKYLGDLLDVEGSLTYTYEVSNRIDFIFTEAYELEQFGLLEKHSHRDIQRTNLLDAAFMFYLENKIIVEVAGTLKHEAIHRRWEKDGNLYESRSVYRLWDIDASVGYRFR